MQAALERYETACGGAPERLVSGSDDFTMFLWEPSVSKKPLQRLTGHMQLINQVHPGCSLLVKGFSGFLIFMVNQIYNYL